MPVRENAAKEERVRTFLKERGFDFALLQGRDHFAWITGGGVSSPDVPHGPPGPALFLGAAGERILLAPEGEADRLRVEEVDRLGYEVVPFPWGGEGGFIREVTRLAGSRRVAADRPLPGAEPLPEDFRRLRVPLLPVEVERYRKAGFDASCALLEAARSAGPGFKEYEIEAVVAAACLRRELRPVAVSVACDDRIDRFHRPPPKDTPFYERLVIGLCAEWKGLHVTLARHLYTRTIPKALDRRHDTVAEISAAVLAATRPGRTLSELYAVLDEAYARAECGEAWRAHPQGGLTGYLPIEAPALPGREERVAAVEAVTWGPALEGVVSEDTVLVTERGIELLTRGDGWDYLPVEAGGRTVDRPQPLVI